MNKYTDGVHDISNDYYHASEGISRSGLWEFKRAPIHYWDRYLNPDREPQKTTKPMKLGEITHCAVLEPDEFKRRYARQPIYLPLPKAVRLMDVGREEFEEFKAQKESIIHTNGLTKKMFEDGLEGKETIPIAVYDECEALSNSVWKNPVASALFKGVEAEKSIYFTHKTGLQVKVRPDAWVGTVVTDLKTCVDASYNAFQRVAFGKGYFLQAAMIHQALKSLGIDMEKFVFFCVEKTGVMATVYYPLDDGALAYGLQQFDQLMEQMAWCLERNQWDGYESRELCLPGYAKYED